MAIGYYVAQNRFRVYLWKLAGVLLSNWWGKEAIMTNQGKNQWSLPILWSLFSPHSPLPVQNSCSRPPTWYAATAKLLQSRPTLCDPRDGSPPDSSIHGILQARTLEWVAISFSMQESEKWKWSPSVMSDPQRPHGLQPSRLLRPWDVPGKSTGVGCHRLLHICT